MIDSVNVFIDEFDKLIMHLFFRPKQLPCIEDAWNFPISQEIASRQNAAVQGQSVSSRI